MTDGPMNRRMNPRQRPTLPRTYARSTIGGSRLNFRVRNGNGCDPAPMTTGKLNFQGVAAEHTPAGTCARVAVYPRPLRKLRVLCQLKILQTVVFRHHPRGVRVTGTYKRINGQASRQISIGKLHISRYVHIRPINLVVFQVPSGVLRPRDNSSCGGFHA